MTDNPIPNPAFYAKLATALATIVSVGFLAWAGLIWTRSDDLMKANNAIIASQQRIELKLEFMTEAINEHRKRPWHDEAGRAHAATRREMDGIRQRMGLIEDKVGNGR